MAWKLGQLKWMEEGTAVDHVRDVETFRNEKQARRILP